MCYILQHRRSCQAIAIFSSERGVLHEVSERRAAATCEPHSTHAEGGQGARGRSGVGEGHQRWNTQSLSRCICFRLGSFNP